MNTDQKMGLQAKLTLKANPNLNFVAKCQRGLAANETAMTIITFTDGTETRCWNNANGRQVSSLARQKRLSVAKAEYVVADRATKVIQRTLSTFRLDGINLIAE